MKAGLMLRPDWRLLQASSLFAPLHPVIASLPDEGFLTLGQLNARVSAQAVTVNSGHPLRFVAQATGKLSFEEQYEPRCYLTGEVQTRTENWHDLLNALVWLTYPKAKAAINARHFHSLTQTALQVTRCSERGAVRDTNTLLDESGVIVAYSDETLAGLLRSFSWKELFWQQRAQVKSCMGFYLFGHGLYEKALKPYTGMTGQGLLLAVEPAFFSWSEKLQTAHLDTRLAAYLADPENCKSTRELSPVPLLGVPGWAQENNNESYYDNTDYFRAGRRAGKPDGA